MITHLKTIAVLVVILVVVYLIIMFPKIMCCISGGMLYVAIYNTISDKNDDNELSGPFNAGGRDLD